MLYYDLISIKIEDYNRQNVITSTSEMKTMNDFIDKLLITTNNFSFMEALNTMQSEANYTNNGIVKHPNFENKSDIPIYFLNLILKSYNLRIIKKERR